MNWGMRAWREGERKCSCIVVSSVLPVWGCCFCSSGGAILEQTWW